MAKLIPLGFLSTLIGRLFTFASKSVSNLTWLGAAYVPLANGNWFIFGGSSTGTATSNYNYATAISGSFTLGTLPASKIWGRAATNGTRLLATPRQSDTTGAYTDNGTTWTSTTIFASAVVVRDTIWDGTYFLVLSEDATANLAYSTDAITWTRIDTGNGGYTIRFDGASRYIILEDSATNIHRTCTASPIVAGNWGNITLPAAARWQGLAYGNGIWVALQNSSTSYATSPDGTTWTSRTLPRQFAATGDYNAQMVFANGYFYWAEGNGASGELIRTHSSPDGINWTEQNYVGSGDVRNFNAWAFNTDNILGVGYSSSTDATDRANLGS